MVQSSTGHTQETVHTTGDTTVSTCVDYGMKTLIVQNLVEIVHFHFTFGRSIPQCA